MMRRFAILIVAAIILTAAACSTARSNLTETTQPILQQAYPQ
jgi:outer membrane biogenesis lipoprotein LolB